MSIKNQAAEFVAKLEGNVDALYSDAITFVEFSRRQRVIWAEVDAAFAGPAVRAALRKRAA